MSISRLAPGTVDVHAYVGPYPFRHLPHPDPEVLVGVLEREGAAGAWVGSLPAAFHRDPGPANDELFERLRPFAVLHPAPVVRPDWPAWERTLRDAAEAGAPAVKAYPPQWGMGPGDPHMTALARACGDAGVVLLLTVRFEDLRQRHGMDTAGDLSAAAVRAIARASDRCRIVVLGAGRGTIEEVHWGLSPDERSRIWWDISWIWGPPEDELAHLVRTIGAGRLLYGTGWPLRLTQAPRANVALLPEELRSARFASAADVRRDQMSSRK
jgi:predicted TIM-barrel fold metal-dependent hydrolase